jgi:hypothetical protein
LPRGKIKEDEYSAGGWVKKARQDGPKVVSLFQVEQIDQTIVVALLAGLIGLKFKDPLTCDLGKTTQILGFRQVSNVVIDCRHPNRCLIGHFSTHPAKETAAGTFWSHGPR